MPEIKPLTTKSEQEKKQRQQFKIIVGIIIAVLMIASTIGYAVLEREHGQKQGTASYNNYTFQKTETGWQTSLKINNQDIALNTFNLPQDVENISTQGSPLLANFMNKVIYIVAASQEERKAAIEYNALGKFALRIQLACSQKNENETFCVENNLPIKSCDDVDWQTVIIMLEELGENSNDSATINYKNSCLEIKGKKEELVKANEKALFMIFGII
ncbi:MAG: hypothetical protein ACPLXC_01815 [Candidatus Pacearchaeota archaeon]